MKEQRQAPVITESEFRRVIAVAKETRHSKRNAALMYMSFGLGLRAKEMAALRVTDVLDESGKLRNEVMLGRNHTKGGKQRLIYLSNRDARKSLTDYVYERKQDLYTLRPEAALFQSAKGGAFTPNTMQMLFKRIYRAAGLPDASSHTGRRTFATSLIESGADLKAVSKLMGHGSVAMTARYVEDNPLRLSRMCEGVVLGISSKSVQR